MSKRGLEHESTSARQGAIQIANCSNVGAGANLDKASAMFKLTFEMRLSYEQVIRLIGFLLMLLHTL